MPRSPRDAAPGIYHVTAHAIAELPLFRDDVDRLDFNALLGALAKRPKWTLIAACLMRTHFHLLVDVRDESLPRGMHQLNGRYAQRFNARHRLRGHVFSERYAAQLVKNDAYLLTAFRYIARNPIVAGLCATPDAWRWSSYASSVGLADEYSCCNAALVVGCFGRPRAAAVNRLRAFVEAA